MNVYVASSFLRKDDVRALHQLLRAQGHTISYDWTPEDATPYVDKPAALRAYLAAGAERDFLGVIGADVLIVLHDDRGRGMATEFGLALGRGLPVIVVGARPAAPHLEMRNVFYYLPAASILHVDTPEDAVAALSTHTPSYSQRPPPLPPPRAA